jgi:ABC-2 type transport system ATP-binding protein
VISVSQLTKAYGAVMAVDHVSFEVSRGRIVGFLGPNGAGKSTTLRMLTCYLPPTSGTATVNGFDIFHQSEQVRGSLGYLPENCPLYTEMKVREYLDFRGRLRKMDRAERRRRMDYVIERCWLGAVHNRIIGHLSKGYRQRVGLADALLHNPAVLILDEPTVGLDPTQIIETRKLIRDLGGDHTVVLSTHILPEVEAVCDEAVIISGGRIVASGSPDELRASRRMQARVLVECRGPAEQVRNALAHVSGVNKVEILNGHEDRAYTVAAVRPEPSRDVREEVARTVQQNGWPLREIRLEHATLEEFFVQVTANQAVGKATPAQPAGTSPGATLSERTNRAFPVKVKGGAE